MGHLHWYTCKNTHITLKRNQLCLCKCIILILVGTNGRQLMHITTGIILYDSIGKRPQNHHSC